MLKAISAFIIATRFRLRQAILKLFYVRFRKAIAIVLVYSGLFMRMTGLRRAGLKFVLKGRRIDKVERADVVIRHVIQQQNAGENLELYELLECSGQVYEGYDDRVLIMKLPIISGDVVVEKGALIFKFSEVFAPALLALDVQLLSKYFCVILEPSSAGYSAEEILAWITTSPEKVVILTPDDGDFQFLAAMKTNLIPVRLGAADWVNPVNFNKIKNGVKNYDAIYVANFNPVKRVDRYIRAVVRVARQKKNYHAALVCAIHGEV